MDWGVRTVSLLLCLGVLLATIQRGYAERKIVCYYTNWSIYRPGTAKFSPQNINPYLCTHLIYAFGGFTKDNALKPFDKYQDIEKGGYAKFTGLKTYNKNLKTLLAIGGWNEGSSRFSPMVADAGRRREFVKNSIKFLRKNHFDGLDLDWEYPAFRDGGKPRDKDNYASLVQELREEFERESSKTGRPRLLLSMAVPAGIEYIDKGYDVPRLNEYLDFINLLSYDYHSSYEPAVNHHSPLYPLEEDNEYNYDSELTIDYTVSYLLKMGASPDKIILGIPTYGRSYTLFNQDATDLGSPADGPGTEGDATREKGYLAYYEICDSLAASEAWEVVQPNAKAMGPYAFKEDQWVGYDDEDIVKLKAKYANEKELGGIMFWTIDNDDFRGKCHDRPYPLIEAAKEALLSKDTSAGQRSKPVNGRKKPRLPGVQSNTVGRKLSPGGRRTTTTAAPATRKRVSTPRPKFRTFSRSKASDEEDDEEEVDRRSYEPSSDEEEDSDRGNVVRSADNADRSRNRGKSRPKARPSTRHRNKLTRRKNENNADSDESLSNKLTTPEPPTTPDPGTDFKCEDEGFFSHPRDCKKYFWCLDSGPGGLGVVAHQFTCPSGLVFNKAADSCDYPRNVVCPKSKASQSAASTTRAPITAATSRTTYLYSTTRKPSTEKPDLDEEYEEEYDDEEDVEEEEEKEEPKTTTTPKPLLYKTITRSRPTTTTTTTTETPATTASKPESSELEKVIGLEDEEDPKVIKELIKLIKKAGGIEQLEKHLSFQSKSPDESSSDKERATPATISRTLYERVLSRQAGKTAGTNFANGPGGAQFEGLDDVPEVKNLRRLQKPQYVTIERPKPSTKEPPVEEEDEGAEEELDDDNEDVASSEEQAVSNPFLASSTQRATPNYINIRRTRPSATTSRNENDVDEKDEDEGEEVAIHPRRPGLLSRSTESNSSDDAKEQESRSTVSEDNSSTTKFRYVSVQRFRSTTPRLAVTSETTSSIQEPVTESASSSETPEFLAKSEVVTTTPSTTVLPSTTPSTTTGSNVVLDTETEKEKVPPSPGPEASSTTEAVKLVEDSATEILLTTAAASLSTLSSPSTRAASATVAQPRPFGFSRRNRPSTDATSSTTPLPSSSEQARPKVSIPSRNHTRSSFLGGRGRLRPKPEVADNDQLQPPRATTEEPLPRPSRPRQRGTSRYTPPTIRPKTEPPSNPAVRDRARTTEPPGAIDSTPEPPRRRFRRPVSRAATEHTKSNELEDSPIVRITQGPPRNTFVSRSRSAVKDEQDDDKITNIRVFKKPSAVNRDIYARTRYTKKRNNLETEEPRKDTSSYSSTTASTVTLLEAGDLATADRPSSEPATEQPRANTVDEEISASTRSSVATDAQITATNLEDGVTTTESFLENEVVTVTPDGGVDQGLVTTNSAKAEDFDPNVIRIVFPSNGTDSKVQENRNVAVPRRRKVLLRKRPVASSSTASQEEEEEDKLVSRKRKVIRRLRPVQSSTTETTVDTSSTEEDQIVLRFGSTSPKQEDTTDLDLSTESFDASTAETSRTIDYGIDNDFTGATLGTPTAETAIENEELSDPDAITMASTIIDSFTGESTTETSTAESTTSTSLFNSTDANVVLDETSTPSGQTATLTTTVSTVATQSSRRLEPYDRTYYLDSRYVRKKFVRRRPIDSSENVSGRNPASRSLIRVSSTTENSNLEGLSKRRKGLFVRRRPVSSTTTTTTTTAQVVESKGGKLSDERDLELEEQIDSEDATLRMNRAHDETLFTIDLPAKSDSAEFWSHYTTATPTSHEDLAPLTPRTEMFIEEHSTPASNRRPEFRPRYRVPESLKKTVSTEITYALDSSPEETEETNDSKLKYHNFRQPRTRYNYREGVGEEKEEGNEESVPDATESPSFDFSSQLRTRFYARRPVSSTEPPVTETLVPARKFDYVADAHRRQQSLRTTPRMQNEDSTTLRSPSEEIQNLVDADYTTTIPPKPQVTRLVTSVEESGTTERQKILIKTKYSSLTSTTRIPLQTTPATVQSVVSESLGKSKGSSGDGNEDESANEIRQGNVERSTLPIEGEFLQQPVSRFTTESHESSTIEIESVFSNLIGSRDQLS